MGLLSKEQIEDILDVVVETPKRNHTWKNDNLQFCCTVHGESTPSAGINCNYKDEKSGKVLQVVHCFSCGFKGSIAKFILNSLPDRFKSTKEVLLYLQRRYGVDLTSDSYSIDDSFNLDYYEDSLNSFKEKRIILPLETLAPFKSGKETYGYFFNRGFSIEDMKEYKIGRDIENRTVTIPVYWEDGELGGVLGRYIDSRPKNMRYKIYSFPKGSMLYPLDKLEVKDDTIILVEGCFDVMMLRKWGFKNSLAVMGNGLSKEQLSILLNKCSKVILLLDDDKGGREGVRSMKKLIKNKLEVIEPTYSPKWGKDVSEWGKLETKKVIKSCSNLDFDLPILI